MTLSGLNPNTIYHYRVVASNISGTATGADRTFTTFPFNPNYQDTCPNSHVRQQTSAAGLLDCRAYELVSAADTAGYDVESNLVKGQTPFGGYPLADGRVLYGVQDGGIPGTGNPTNRGVDPYVATRSGERLDAPNTSASPPTIPSQRAPSPRRVLEADAGLETFAFGGPEICSPCFEDGSTGIPVRLPDGRTDPGDGRRQRHSRPLNPRGTSPSTSPQTALTWSSARPSRWSRAGTKAKSRSTTATSVSSRQPLQSSPRPRVARTSPAFSTAPATGSESWTSPRTALTSSWVSSSPKPAATGTGTCI